MLGRLLGGLRVEHPPAGLSSSLVLDTNEAVVEAEVVTDRILKGEESDGLKD